MASHSEIALVGSTKMGAAQAPKSEKKRARNAQSRKAAKRAGAHKNSNQGTETPPLGSSVVPVMKLRAVDFVEDTDTLASRLRKAEEQNSDNSDDDASRIIQMPAPASDIGNDQTDISAESPFELAAQNSDGTPAVTDPELLELLEQLSTTIDTANTVFDVASNAPAEEAAGLDAKPEPSPQPEADPDTPPPLAAEFADAFPVEPTATAASWGFGLVGNAAIAGLILATGTAWLTYTNPWLLESKPAVLPVLEKVVITTTAPSEKMDQPEASPANQVVQVVKSAALAPSEAPAAYAPPPDDDLVPMEAAAPPAPAPTASASSELRVAAGRSVPLNIALPATPDQTEISVMVQDVPKRVKLSAGKNLGAGNWLLEERHLDKLTLATGKKLAPGTYQLEVIFVRSDGKVPETRKVALIVQSAASEASTTASAIKLPSKSAKADTGSAKMVAVKPVAVVASPAVSPPVAAPVPEIPKLPALTQSEVKTILTRGGALLSEGDIAGARLLLQYAAERGSKVAMVKLGESYDPRYLLKLGAHGVQPDSKQAALWYKRASATQ